MKRSTQRILTTHGRKACRGPTDLLSMIQAKERGRARLTPRPYARRRSKSAVAEAVHEQGRKEVST